MIPVVLILLLALGCSHDARRENPLDPELTSAPQLVAAFDDTTGVVRLSWSPYDGKRDFAAWWVLRRQAGHVLVDTLARLSDLSVTAWTDSHAVLGTDYTYRVSAVNRGGLEQPSAPLAGRLRGLPSLQLTGVEIDSRTASATISWTPYVGPRFETYQLWRTRPGIPPVVIELADSSTPSYVDTSLQGNVHYSYRVVVLTKDGQSVGSDTLTGVIHPLVASWPLDFDPQTDFVRLYAVDDRIEALVGSPLRVSLVDMLSGAVRSTSTLFEYDKLLDQVAEQQLLIGLPVQSKPRVIPRTVAMARDEQGLRYVTVATRRKRWLQVHEADGTLRRQVHYPFAGAAVDLSMVVGPQIGLWISTSTQFDFAVVAFDSLSVHSGGDGLTHLFPLDSSTDGAEALRTDNFERAYGLGHLLLASRSQVIGSVGHLGSSFFDSTWDELRIEADVVPEQWADPSVSLGAPFREDLNLGLEVVPRLEPDLSMVRLRLDVPGDEVCLDRFDNSITEVHCVDYPSLMHARYRLGLQEDPGRISVEAPFLWMSANDDSPEWGTIVRGRDQSPALALDQIGLSVGGDGRVLGPQQSIQTMSDLQLLEIEGSRWPLAVATYPESRRVRIVELRVSRVTGATLLPSGGVLGDEGIILGGVGGNPGDLNLPLSASASLDGRVYVLDAGSSRIEVYHQDGRHITGFGGRGSDSGEFDFGDGFVATDLTGSVVVDDEGFIYVADVGNRRIQKFAP